MRRPAVAAVAALLTFAGLAACGDDSGGEASVAEFCELVVAMDASDEGDLSDPDDVAEMLAAFDELLAAAPAELRDDLRTARDKLAEIAEFDVDEDDPGAAFGAFFALFLDPEFIAALERLEEFGVEECGLEPSDDSFTPDLDLDDGFPDADDGFSDFGGELSPETAMPDDVTLTRQAATTIEWDEVDDAFNYRIEAGGRTVGTTFVSPYVVAEVLDAGDVVVEALDLGSQSLGPVSGVEVRETEALVVDWTEAPGGSYYLEVQAANFGSSWTLARAPHIIEQPADDVESVRFGPGVVVEGDDGPRIESPFDHGADHSVELALP